MAESSRPRRAPGRTAWIVVDNLVEAVAVAAAHGDRLVVDLENTLVGYGSTAEERYEAMTAAADLVVADGRVRRLAFLSNGRFDRPLPCLTHAGLEIDALAKARKPHVRLPPLRHLRASLAGAAVYGDQPLTDGALARNLGGIWLQPRRAHEPADPESEPWWPRMMRAASRRTVRRHFQLTPAPTTATPTPSNLPPFYAP